MYLLRQSTITDTSNYGALPIKHVYLAVVKVNGMEDERTFLQNKPFSIRRHDNIDFPENTPQRNSI